jgi:hypothetical protein
VRDLQQALEAAGVEFTNGDQPGVRLKKFKLKDAGQNAFIRTTSFLLSLARSTTLGTRSSFAYKTWRFNTSIKTSAEALSI